LPFLIEQMAEGTHATGSVGYLEHGLAQAERLAAYAYARAQVLALDTFGDLTVPQPSATADDQAHLRALASLYLMAQLEHASLLPSVEMLAGIGISGGVQVDLGPASSKLMEFWRHRHERFSPEERRSLFERLFDSDFDNFMISLCEALYKLDEGALTPGTSNPLQQAKVRTLAEQLAEHLLSRSTGESAFAANDILASTRAATEILKDPHVEHAFGAHTIWKTVETIMLRYGMAPADSASFVVRGKAGLTILAWLADARGVISGSSQPLLGLDNPVIAAAVDWLQTSLTIEQNKSGEPNQAGHAAQPAEGV
jgi:hypothetical protein